jgi:CRISPR-associated protein Cas1
VIRGIEGDCARECFPFIAGWIRSPDFPWQGRRRHGECPDRLNSLLNFGYHLLFTRINALLRVVGLNPYLGFLHAANGRYEALACDVQEAFRPHIDRLVVRLLNLRVIEVADFEESEDGWWLTRPARTRFLQHFAREIERRPMRRRYSLGESIEGQVRSLHAWLTEDRDLVLYRWSDTDV